ncbi:electron carrier/ protein disulfide oxidoreductase [Anaeramoeba flamelloides]|uniref:Electron carrier/ protein disulfide oxidoreductase n=1 Tax=Anaeramoeba flamelloides TaxID=1746091 RepID=A0AAV7YLM1_9EUKA|nr:electron carrier/ protein disulfide oxidoreductase [Anaeramoeba flamelloides]
MGNKLQSLQEVPQITKRRFQKLQKQLKSNVKGIMFVNSECKILYINNTVKNLFQVKEKKLVGNAFEILCPKEQPHLGNESKYLIYSTSELALSKHNQIIDLVWSFQKTSNRKYKRGIANENESEKEKENENENENEKKRTKKKEFFNVNGQLIWANVGILAFHIKKKIVFQIWIEKISSPEIVFEFGDKIRSLEETTKFLKRKISEKQQEFGTLETEKKMLKLAKQMRELTNDTEEKRYQIKLNEQTTEMYQEKQRKRTKNKIIVEHQIKNYLLKYEKKQNLLNQEYQETKKKNETNPLLASLSKFQNEIQQNLLEKKKLIKEIQDSKTQTNDMDQQIERFENDQKNLIFQSPGIMQSNNILDQMEKKICSTNEKIKKIKKKIQNNSKDKTLESALIEKKRLLKKLINENNQMKLKIDQVRSFKTLSLRQISEESFDEFSDTISDSSNRGFISPRWRINQAFLKNESPKKIRQHKPNYIKKESKDNKINNSKNIHANKRQIKVVNLNEKDIKKKTQPKEMKKRHEIFEGNQESKKNNLKKNNSFQYLKSNKRKVNKKSAKYLSKRATDQWLKQFSLKKNDSKNSSTPKLLHSHSNSDLSKNRKLKKRSLSFTELITTKKKKSKNKRKKKSKQNFEKEKQPLYPLEKINNFETFIKLPLPRQYFNEYLTELNVQEMLMFYKDYQIFQEKYTLQNKRKLSKYLIDNYISMGSIFEVNYEGYNQEILQRYQSGDYSYDLFDPIAKRVYKILKDEYFETFLLTSYFTELQELKIKLQNRFVNNSFRNGTLIGEKDSVSVLNRNIIFQGNIMDASEIMQNISEKLIDLLNINSNLNSINDGGSSDGKGVSTHLNCESLSKTVHFQKFEIVCTSLQAINLGELCRLNNLKRKVFFINLYNLMAIHGLISKKHPRNKNSLKKFQKGCTYDIGGKLFNMNDILQILKIKKLEKNSLRIIQDLSITTVDPRMVFTLFSFTSQPIPLQTYYPKSFNKQLTIVTRIHLEKYFHFDHYNGTVLLPQIFSLNWKHFGKNISQLIFWIRNFLSFSDPMSLYLYKIENDKLIVSPDLNFSSAYSLLEHI